MKRIALLTLLLGAVVYAKSSDYAAHIAQLPIAFSLVREDSEQDLELIKRYFSEDKASLLMVSSGGDTAALLAAKAPLKEITLVDPNQAQLALTKIKIQMLSLPTQRRLEILGYLPMHPEVRKQMALAQQMLKNHSIINSILA